MSRRVFILVSAVLVACGSDSAADERINALEAEVASLSARLDEVEGGTEPDLSALQEQINGLAESVDALTARADSAKADTDALAGRLGELGVSIAILQAEVADQGRGGSLSEIIRNAPHTPFDLTR